MSHVLVLGGGFDGLVAAERLAQKLAPEHHITLMSRGGRFLFYPALVRLAFGHCEPDDISFDLREPSTRYEHEIRLVIDEGGHGSIYFRKGPGEDTEASVRQGRFWGWAKWVQEKCWEGLHG